MSLLGVEAIAESDLHPAVNELAQQLIAWSNENLTLLTANRLFVQPRLDLQPAFLDVATGSYGAPVTEADFQYARQQVTEDVNTWVSEQTNGFIPSIVDGFDPGTVFALLNTIFLDAAWYDEFDTKEDQPFTTLDQGTIVTPSFGGSAYVPALINNNLTAVDLPYGGEELAMLTVMPTDLQVFEQSLDNAALSDIINTLQRGNYELTVPNWMIDNRLELTNLLAPLGLPAKPRNLERLVNGGTSLAVMFQQSARVEVDEDGTRAAAVTLGTGITSIPPELRIDQPFVYLLRDRTSGAILFSGRVVMP